MKTHILAAALLAAFGSTPALADQPEYVKVDNGETDVGFGIGLTWSFGAKTAKQGLSVGVKAFSQRKQDSVAGSIGVDFNFANRSFRPNLGVAQLFENEFIDFNYGYDLGAKSWGFGMSTGYVETAKDGMALKPLEDG